MPAQPEVELPDAGAGVGGAAPDGDPASESTPKPRLTGRRGSNVSMQDVFQNTGEQRITTKTQWVRDTAKHGVDSDRADGEASPTPGSKKTPPPAAKLGTLLGVFVPCLQNILGIILFIRLSWIVALQARRAPLSPPSSPALAPDRAS